MDYSSLRDRFAAYVFASAGEENEELRQLALAMWDDEPINRAYDGPTPEHDYLRFQAEMTEKDGIDDFLCFAAYKLALTYKAFKNREPDFYKNLFPQGPDYFLSNPATGNRGHKFTQYAFLPTRYKLAGGFDPNIDGDAGYKRNSIPIPTEPKPMPPLESYEYIDEDGHKRVDWDQHNKDEREYDREKKHYDDFFEQETKLELKYRTDQRFRSLSRKLSGQPLLKEFFGDTPLRFLMPQPPAPVVDPELPFSGTWICSPQGKGKTTLLRHLILSHMEEPCSIIIFDSKGELADSFRDRKYPKDVVTIDPLPYLALNPMDLGTHSVGTLMYVFSALVGAALTPLQSVLFRKAIYLARHVPNATFSTLVQILQGRQFPEALAQLDEEEQEFWTGDGGFNGRTYASTKSEILWRLDSLRPPESVLRTIFNAPKTKVQMAPLMDGNTITIVNNSRALLEPMQSEFFARLFLVMILGAAEQRATATYKHPCYVFMDEAQNVISTATELAQIIYQCRSQKIALLAAHQSLSQIKDPQVQSALGDCAIKYANSDDDAHALAPKLRITPEVLQSLHVGHFALAMRGMPTQTVKIPLPDFSKYPALSSAEIAARTEAMNRRYLYTPAPKSSPVVHLAEPPSLWGNKPTL